MYYRPHEYVKSKKASAVFVRAKPAVDIGSDSEDDVSPGPGQYHKEVQHS